MSDCNELNKGNERKEAIGRNGKFVLLVIYKKLECKKTYIPKHFIDLRFLAYYLKGNNVSWNYLSPHVAKYSLPFINVKSLQGYFGAGVFLSLQYIQLNCVLAINEWDVLFHAILWL